MPDLRLTTASVTGKNFRLAWGLGSSRSGFAAWHREETMRRRGGSFLPVVKMIAPMIASLLLTTHSASAADDCIVEPNLGQTGAGHWYYRSGRAKHRKCWYRQQPNVEVREPGASEIQPSSTPAGEPTVFSLISSLATAFAGTSDQTLRQERTKKDLPVAQTVHADRHQKDNESQNGRSRMPRHSRFSATPIRRRHPESAPGSQSGRPTRSAGDLAAREALFRRFASWQEMRNADSTLALAGRNALFREFLLWQQRQGMPEN